MSFASGRICVTPRRRARVAAFAMVAISALISACGAGGAGTAATGGATTPPGGGGATPAAYYTVSPGTASVSTGGVGVSFSAVASNASTSAIVWKVNGIDGGNASVGTISAAGLYLSPSTLPTPATVTVSAVSLNDASQSGDATVTLVDVTATVSVAVSPSAVAIVAGGASQSFVATVFNASSTAVSWQVDGLPGGDATVGTVSSSGVYTPPATEPAAGSVTVTAVSTADASKSASAKVSFKKAPPVLSGAPSTSVQAGSAYVFTPTVTNTSGAALSFAISGMPLWATFDTTTGQLSGTPSNANAGTYANISISVSTANGRATLAPFSITVVGVPPTIAGTPPASVQAGKAYTFTPSTGNSGGGTLTYSISGQPSWATFSTTTGQLSGTPTNANAGTVSNIAIAVSNAVGTAKLAPFSITVQSAALTIAGTPVTSVQAGKAYAFTPTTSNAGGGTLTYTISAKPAWATFSSSTGQLTGTPATTDIGTFANVSITVSNGTSSATLAAFTITVSGGTTGSATVSWTPPTTRTDGTALVNLSGYRIYYGTVKGVYPNVVTVANPGLSSYVVANLISGTYYFVATAYDASGAESDYSTVGSKVIL